MKIASDLHKPAGGDANGPQFGGKPPCQQRHVDVAPCRTAAKRIPWAGAALSLLQPEFSRERRRTLKSSKALAYNEAGIDGRPLTVAGHLRARAPAINRRGSSSVRCQSLQNRLRNIGIFPPDEHVVEERSAVDREAMAVALKVMYL